MMSRASRRVFVAATAAMAAVAVLHEPSAHADAPVGLFVIERSKNANVIHYDAHVAKDGSLVAAEPVVAYWIMKAENGRKEGLTFLEQKLAYGFEVSPRAGEWNLTIAAYRDRPLRLVQVGGRWRARATIAGRLAYLNKIFIQTKEGGVMPSVRYVDLFGEDAASGKSLREHVDK